MFGKILSGIFDDVRNRPDIGITQTNHSLDDQIEHEMITAIQQNDTQAVFQMFGRFQTDAFSKNLKMLRLAADEKSYDCLQTMLVKSAVEGYPGSSVDFLAYGTDHDALMQAAATDDAIANIWQQYGDLQSQGVTLPPERPARYQDNLPKSALRITVPRLEPLSRT